MATDEQALRAEIAELTAEADGIAKKLGITSPEEEKARTKALMANLHAYNEVKDIAQALLGRLATVEGCTTKSLYARFNLSLTD